MVVYLRISKNVTWILEEHIFLGLYFVTLSLLSYILFLSLLFVIPKDLILRFIPKSLLPKSLVSEPENPVEETTYLPNKLTGGQLLDLDLEELTIVKKMLVCVPEEIPSDEFLTFSDPRSNDLAFSLLESSLPKKYSFRRFVKRAVSRVLNLVTGKYPIEEAHLIIRSTHAALRRLAELHLKYVKNDHAVFKFILLLAVKRANFYTLFSGLVITSGMALSVGALGALATFGFLSFFGTLFAGCGTVLLATGLATFIRISSYVDCDTIVSRFQTMQLEGQKTEILLPSESWSTKNRGQVILTPDERKIAVYEKSRNQNPKKVTVYNPDLIIYPSSDHQTVMSKEVVIYEKISDPRIKTVPTQSINKIVETLEDNVQIDLLKEDFSQFLVDEISEKPKPKKTDSSSFAEAKKPLAKKRNKRWREDSYSNLLKRIEEEEKQSFQTKMDDLIREVKQKDGFDKNDLLLMRDILDEHNISPTELEKTLNEMEKNGKT